MITNKKIEKNTLFKHSVLVGSALLISLGIQFVFSFAMISFGLSQEQIDNLLTDTWTGYLLNTLLSVVTLTFPFLILKNLTEKSISELFQFNSNTSKIAPICVVFAVGLSFAANYVSAFFNEALKRFFDFEAVQPTIGDNDFSDPFELIFTLVCVAAVPALVEEFAFRGLVLNSLRKFGDWPAIFVSAFLFGILHGNFIQIPFAFVVGIGLGIATVMTNSLWPAIIAHFINNSYALLSNAYGQENQTPYLYVFYLFMAAGVFCLITLIKKGCFKQMKKQPSELSAFAKTVRLILSPTVLIFIALMLVTAFLSKAA